jgi:tetratricopeptide (TPR) repeat protein
LIENDDFERRHALPRWFSISKALESGIFANPGKFQRVDDEEDLRISHRASLSTEFAHYEAEWLKNQDESNAEELICVAALIGREEQDSVVAAANTIIAANTAGIGLVDLAKTIAFGDSGRPIYRKIDIAKLKAEIRTRKRLLSTNPRDPLLLTETALCHANLGQLRISEKLIKRALSIAPDSRFVLRSAARFLCHDQRADEALSLLRRSPRLNLDPWLKAAELAIAGITGMPIQGWRKSRILAEDLSLSPRDRSELATEVATLEFSSGSRRAGLRQVKMAAEDPTENATAQVEFLAGKTGNFTIEEFVPDITSAMEAQANHAYRKGELRKALAACEAWQELEPFSTRPAILGSFLSTARSNSIDRGIALAEAGLFSNPSNSNLLNNLAVLLAYKGEIDAADEYARRARNSSEDKNDIANIATKGLIHFRRGEVDEALLSYEMAIEKAVAERNVEVAVRAYAFLAREMCRISPSIKPLFRKELETVERKLSRMGKNLPRDVAVIASEFSDDGSETQQLLLDFKAFEGPYLDRMLD